MHRQMTVHKEGEGIFCLEDIVTATGALEHSNDIVATFVKKRNVPWNIRLDFGKTLYLCSVEQWTEVSESVIQCFSPFTS